MTRTPPGIDPDDWAEFQAGADRRFADLFYRIKREEEQLAAQKERRLRQEQKSRERRERLLRLIPFR